MKKLLLLLLSFPLLMQAQGTTEKLSGNYPQVEATGDAQKDHDNWINAKKDWITNNPDEYRALGGDPDIIKEQTTEEVPKKNKEDIAFSPQKMFTLSDIGLVSNEDYVLSNAEARTLLASLEKDYTIGKTQLQFAADNDMRLYEADRMDVRGVEKRMDTYVEWVFNNKNCHQCSKTLFLTLEEESNKKLVYLMKSEDTNDKISYRFTFEMR